MTRDEEWLLREKYRGERTEEFLADCARLERGEPVAYVIGWVPFLNTKIFLDSHPLIPRPETEFWVERVIKELHTYGGPASGRVLDLCTYGGPASGRVLDLCAGSGCIGVAVLKSVPNVSVDFAEIDGEHHPTIEKNLRENGIDPLRARIFGGDLFEQITGTYDFILANPPYIDPVLNRTEESVRTYEPKEALYGGHRGLEIIERIVKESPRFLTEHGVLYIEHEPEQAEAIRRIGEENGFSVVTYKDQYENYRFSRLLTGAGATL